METVNKVESLIAGNLYASTSPHRNPDQICIEQDDVINEDTDIVVLSISQARALRDWLDKALPVSAVAPLEK